MNLPRHDSPRRGRWLLASGVLIIAAVSGGLFGLHWWTQYELRTAKDLLAEMRFEEAGRLLDTYLRIRPRNAEAHLTAARAKRRAGEAAAAEHHLDEFDRLEGSTPASSLERVFLRAEHGALGNREASLRSSLEKGDQDPVLLLEALARNYQTSGRAAEALICLEDLLKERPLHPRARVWRAQIWGQMKRWDDALDDARLAVELRPGSLEARLIWAEANEHVGQTETAVREYGWLFEQGQKSPEVVLALARCWQDLARFAEARQTLDAFLAGEPARADVLVERGRLALREGGSPPAETYFRQAVAADPNNLNAHRFLLHCLRNSGTAEECVRVDRQLRQLEIRLGQIEQLGNEVQATPDETEPRYRLGVLLLQTGREEEGLNWLNSVLELNPGHEQARAALAKHSQATGLRPSEGGKQ